MANATADIQMGGVGRDGKRFHLPVDGGTTIYEGTMVAQLTATGMLVPATTSGSGPVIGIATHQIVNSGADGAERCVVETDRIYARTNGSGGNAFSEASLIGSACYAFDDSTVYDNSAGGTLPFAGSYRGIDADGKVLVKIEPSPALGGDEEFQNGLATDTISELTAATGVTVDGVLLKDSQVTTDVINEKTAAAGVTADGVLLKDGGIVCADAATIEVDTINEATAAAGVTIDGILLKDNKVTASGGIDAGASPGVLTDIVAEKTGAAGVTIDGLLVKDSALPAFAPNITYMSFVTGTFVNGLCTVTVGAGQTVTADSKAFPCMSAIITGSANVGGIAHMIAENVAGGSGVGQLKFRVLGADGNTDADAAGLFAAFYIN